MVSLFRAEADAPTRWAAIPCSRALAANREDTPKSQFDRLRLAIQTTYFRGERVSTINGRFSFSTRVRALEGAYFSRAEAERSIPRYIDRMLQSLAIPESRNSESEFRP